ncbi:F0F1 ATP synthase subunit gamma [Thetidibacter halocola]|uniref:F0F1 ATP synthase subunit gamma n=1 Tax=Thetidibacter halocola TaxID=2827239 RepID=A0A8J7WIT2_9RHOB|nr:F0F1 ATP synthase subunit gamma [Thetidibacter halocola]MBS0126026.1 F0F1 ATP synthase subunit gamma [Thetidibacter halocola]
MTDRLEDIARQLVAVDEIGEVVGALRAIASGHVTAAQGALAAMSAFEAQIRQAMLRLAAPPAQTAAPGAGIVLLIGAAQGFCGAYPQRLAQAGMDQAALGAGFIVIGARTQAMLSEAGLDIVLAEDLPATPAGVPRLASRITDRIVDAAQTHPGPIIALCGGDQPGQPVQVRRIWPPARDDAAAPVPLADPPLTTLPHEALVAGLLQETLFSAVARALMEGLRAENMARVEAMARADGNLRTRRAELRQRFQQARQEAMTTELIELSMTGQADPPG